MSWSKSRWVTLPKLVTGSCIEPIPVISSSDVREPPPWQDNVPHRWVSAPSAGPQPPMADMGRVGCRKLTSSIP